MQQSQSTTADAPKSHLTTQEVVDLLTRFGGDVSFADFEMVSVERDGVRRTFTCIDDGVFRAASVFLFLGL